MGESATTNTPRAGAYTHAGVFFVSMALLLLEIALTRVFSYTIWYHFAFITIAVALLGFGASGSVLALWQSKRSISVDGVIPWTALAAGAGVIVVLQVLYHVSFDPFDLVTDARQTPLGLLYIGSATIPFFFAGMTIALALNAYPRQSSTLYGVDLLGAGFACILFPWILLTWGAPNAVRASCLLMCLSAIAFTRMRYVPVLVSSALVVSCAWISGLGLDLETCKSKVMSTLVQSRESQVLFAKWSTVFRTEVIDVRDTADTPKWTYGYIGASRNYRGARPDWQVIAHDGDAIATMMRSDDGTGTFPVLRSHTMAFPYLFQPAARVFVGGVGGGGDIVAALSNGAVHVDGAELDPVTVQVLCEEFSDYSGRLCDRDDVNVVVGDTRNVLTRMDGEYDVIQITGVDTLSSTLAGAHLLNENYVYTVEAVHQYFDRLTEDGLLSFHAIEMTGDPLPATRVPRYASLIAQALNERGIDDSGRHCIAVATLLKENTIATVSMIARLTPFSDAELSQARVFADTNRFAFWHFPGETIDTSTSIILRSTPEERAAYYRDSRLDLSPTTNDRPFFFHFHKWRNLPTRETLQPNFLFPTGNFVLIASLVFAGIASLVLIIFPALLAIRGHSQAERISSWHLLYFCAIGMGFMFLEIGLIQRLVQFLGHPTYSLTVTLCALLIFAGVGSLLSVRTATNSSRTVWRLFAALCAVMLIEWFLGRLALERWLTAPLPVRIALSVAAIAPLGVVLGMFFPIGLRALSERLSYAVPLAWAANGSCSVLGTVLAVILATVFGFRVTMFFAVMLYLLAAVSFECTHRGGATRLKG